MSMHPELFESLWVEERERRAVDHDWVGSRAYRSLVRRAVGPAAAETVHSDIVRMLRHRSGTPFEDLYAHDMGSGVRLGSVVNAAQPKRVEPTPRLGRATREAVSRGEEVLLVHNHPDSLPPSACDYLSVMMTGSTRGVVACHDGSLYVFEQTGPLAPGYTLDERTLGGHCLAPSFEGRASGPSGHRGLFGGAR